MYQSVFLTFQLLVIILQMRTQGNSPKLLMGGCTSVTNLVMRVVTFKAVPGMARTYYYHHDHLDSTTLITNESGEVVQRVEYLPYGEVFLERHGGDNHSMPLQVQRPLGLSGRFLSPLHYESEQARARNNVEKEGVGQDARSGLVRLQCKILRPCPRSLPPDRPAG